MNQLHNSVNRKKEQDTVHLLAGAWHCGKLKRDACWYNGNAENV
jgi:hypothetical protein